MANGTKEFPCDHCEYVAQNPQGLGAHKRAKHGIKGQSSSANRASARKAAAVTVATPPVLKPKATKKTKRNRTNGVRRPTPATLAPSDRALSLLADALDGRPVPAKDLSRVYAWATETEALLQSLD